MSPLASLLEDSELISAKQTALKLQQDLIEESDELLDVKLFPNSSSSLRMIVSCGLTNRDIALIVTAGRVVQADGGSNQVKGHLKTAFDLPHEFKKFYIFVCEEIAFVDALKADQRVKARNRIHNRAFKLLTAKDILVKAGGSFYRIKHKMLAKKLECKTYMAVSDDSSVGYRTIYVLQLESFNTLSNKPSRFDSVKEMLERYRTDELGALWAGMSVVAHDLALDDEAKLSLASGTSKFYSAVGDVLTFYAVEKVKL